MTYVIFLQEVEEEAHVVYAPVVKRWWSNLSLFLSPKYSCACGKNQHVYQKKGHRFFREREQDAASCDAMCSTLHEPVFEACVSNGNCDWQQCGQAT